MVISAPCPHCGSAAAGVGAPARTAECASTTASPHVVHPSVPVPLGRCPAPGSWSAPFVASSCSRGRRRGGPPGGLWSCLPSRCKGGACGGEVGRRRHEVHCYASQAHFTHKCRASLFRRFPKVRCGRVFRPTWECDDCRFNSFSR